MYRHWFIDCHKRTTPSGNVGVRGGCVWWGREGTCGNPPYFVFNFAMNLKPLCSLLIKKMFTTRHIMVKQQKIRNKDKILKAVRGKINQIVFEGPRQIEGWLLNNNSGTKDRRIIFNMLRENYCRPRILYSLKNPLRMKMK